MIRFLVILIQVAIVVAAAIWLAERPGVGTVNWQGWRIETTFWVMVLALLITAVAVALVYRMWRFLRRMPVQIIETTRSNRQKRGYAALASGMVALAADDASEATRHARLANGLLDDSSLTMLLNAQAAQLEGDDVVAKKYFEAMRSNPETALLGLRGLLDQALNNDDRIEALRLANVANVLQPNTSWVLEQLFDLQVAARDWEEANKTLLAKVKHKTIEKNEGNRCRAAILLEQSRDSVKNGEMSEAFEFVRLAQELNPELAPAVLLYAEMLSATGRKRRASSVLEDAWRRKPCSEVAEAYRILDSDDDLLAQVKRIEHLFEMAPDHVESHIALGAAMLSAGLWGEARRHLTRAAQIAPTTRVCRLMAVLEEDTSGDHEKIRKWLEKAITADTDYGWVCESCSAAAREWSALCECCGSFNNLNWRSTTKFFALDAGATIPSSESSALIANS